QTHRIGPSVYKRIYFYNEIGQLFLEQRDDPATWLEYLYDVNGRPTAVKTSWVDGTPHGGRTMLCDNQGRVIEESVYDARGDLETKIMRTYDDGGRISSVANGIDPDQQYYSKTVYEYDDAGNVTERKEYDRKGVSSSTTYAYEFDQFLNWNKQTAV